MTMSYVLCFLHIIEGGCTKLVHMTAPLLLTHLICWWTDLERSTRDLSHHLTSNTLVNTRQEKGEFL